MSEHDQESTADELERLVEEFSHERRELDVDDPDLDLCEVCDAERWLCACLERSGVTDG